MRGLKAPISGNISLDLYRPTAHHYWTDSGIDTDEPLDDSEAGIDCDADATTAIPVGSKIKIENELCLVTATGATLTVARGYGSSTAATHLTNQDIYRLDSGGCVLWFPGQDDAYSATIRDRSGKGNNGTLVGTTWTRLPSGLYYPHMAGTDDYILAPAHASLDLTNGFTFLCWFKFEVSNTITQIFWRGTGGAYADYSVTFDKRNSQKLFTSASTGAADLWGKTATTVLAQDTWYMVGLIWDKVNNKVTIILNGADDGNAASSGVLNPADSTFDFQMGCNVNLAADLTGGIILQTLILSPLTVAQTAAWYRITRHLFGV